MKLGDIDRGALAAAVKRLPEIVWNPDAWPSVLRDISGAAGGEGAFILKSDARTINDSPCNPEIKTLQSRYFVEGWYERDLRSERGFPLLISGAKVVIEQDILTPDEMRRAAFYRDYLEPEGFKWVAGIHFRAGAAHWALAIQRSARFEAFTTVDKPILASICDELTQAATLSTAVGRQSLVGVTNVLNRLERAALIIDRMGSVIQISAAAERLFSSAFYVDRARKLRLSDRRACREFEDFIDRLRRSCDTAFTKGAVIIVRSDDVPTLLLRSMPLEGALQGPFDGGRALVLLTSLTAPTPTKASLLRFIYGLTPTEATIAMHLANGASLEKIAFMQTLSKGTVRNHLKAIFRKTGTSQQSVLVSLISRIQ